VIDNIARRLELSVLETDLKRGPRGYDAHKQEKGCKRHLLVDTQGFVLKVVVSAADAQTPTMQV
jgi:hypothetical protein